MAILFGCRSRDDGRRIRNIEAFARAYGLVRWFHPSDEAQRVDWNDLALYGVERVAGCRSTAELRRELEALLLPVAPGVRFSDDAQWDGAASIRPADTTGMSVVAWQHKGVDTEQPSFFLGDEEYFYSRFPYYAGKRTSRLFEPRSAKWLALADILSPASDYGDHVIKIRTRIKKGSEGPRLFFRASTKTDWLKAIPFSPEAAQQLVPGEGEWTDCERSVRITGGNRAEPVMWGIYVDGPGSFSVGEIEVENTKTGKVVKRSGSKNRDWTYRYRPNDAGGYDISVREVSTREPLFDEHAAFGECESERLAEGLYIHVPLALYGTESATYPSGDPQELRQLRVRADSLVASDEVKMFADILVAWNAMKYFDPYLAEMGLDWDGELGRALTLASACETYDSRPMQLMTAKLEDAHIRYPEKRDFDRDSPKYLPLQIRKIGGRLFVTESFDPQLQKGDIVVSVNGSDALADFGYYEEMISGAPHYKACVAGIDNKWIRHYAGPGKIRLRIERSGKKLSLTTRNLSADDYFGHIRNLKPRECGWLNDSTLYLNLNATDLDGVKKWLTGRKPDQTVIVDMRGPFLYMLQNVLDPLCPGFGGVRMRDGTSLTPFVTRPEIPVLADTLSEIAPPEPNRKNIFLVYPGNMSHHESILDYVRYKGLGCIVGTKTGGCTGAMNHVPLPSGTEVSFTGMKCLSNMGPSGYFYRAGIAPDLYIEDTPEGIRAGRDAALEAALRIACGEQEL